MEKFGSFQKKIPTIFIKKKSMSVQEQSTSDYPGSSLAGQSQKNKNPC